MESGRKKSEFPDAINLALIRKYAKTSIAEVYIVTKDSDFDDITGIHVFKKIKELLNDINLKNEYCEEIIKYFSCVDVRNHIISEIEEEFWSYDFEVDGQECDRKGIYSGIEYEESDLKSISNIDFKIDSIDNIDLDEAYISATLSCKANLEFNCTFFDDEHSIWDSEEKSYINPYYGTIHEIHNVCFSANVILSFKKEEDVVEFDIDEINLGLHDIKLNEFTVQHGSRERVDNPYINNACPDCGEEITFKNNGGNGFCEKCACNH